MREDRGTVDEELVLDRNVVAENSNVLNARPPSDGRVPADDGAHDPSVILDRRVRHDDASLESDTSTDLDARADDDVGSDERRRVDCRRRVNEDVATADPRLLGVRELLRALRGEMGEVEAGSWWGQNADRRVNDLCPIVSPPPLTRSSLDVPVR